MDIEGLRHVITPDIEFVYTADPTIESYDLKQIDYIDDIQKGKTAYFGLSNKLQTKRKGSTVDLLDFRVSSAYEFDPRIDEDGVKRGGTLSDVYFKLKLLPFTWLRFEGDALYDSQNNNFSDGNYDLRFELGKERTFSIGQRYNREDSNQVTSSLSWRFNPKWKFSVYGRYEFGHNPDLVHGLAEQQYVITRDLHCWQMDLAYDRKRQDDSTIWVIFRLKAFPELEFGFDQSYHGSGSGSQEDQE
jgi:hypothetical protein